MIGQVGRNLHLGHCLVGVVDRQHGARCLCPAVKQGVTIGITGVDLQVQGFTRPYGFWQCVGVLNKRGRVRGAVERGDIEQLEAQGLLVVDRNGAQGVGLRFGRIGKLHIQVAACFFVLNIQGFIAPLVGLDSTVRI